MTPTSKCNECGSRCKLCQDKKKAPCEGCGQREVVFKGEDTNQKFCSWLFHKQHKSFVIIAHNLKSYDGFFLQEYLIQNGIKHRSIFDGSKIMLMTIYNGLGMRAIDSLSFLPMKLAKFSACFGLTTVKGAFPHFFNTMQNFNYVGPYPEATMYGVDSMSTTDRAQFLEWYKTVKHDTFDFQKEILHYCRTDVNLRRKGCLMFRQIIMESTDGVDPLKYTTLASAAMAINHTTMIPERYEIQIADDETWHECIETKDSYLVKTNGEWSEVQGTVTGKRLHEEGFIAQVPSQGYSRDQYSKSSIEWIQWTMEDHRRHGEEIFIQHALNGGEYHVPGTHYKVDGFSKTTKTAYEYHVSIARYYI